ncbi:MAG: peptidoglycan synthetase FtsI [Actinomycetota bacterium]|jgi:cell division protein FtsI (penicillin-binding protein 3)
MSIAAGSRGRRHEPQRASDIARAAARQTVRTLTEDLKPGKISHRLAYVRIGVSLMLCAMLLRTGYLQTIGSGQYRDASVSQRTRVNTVRAERGSILDRNGLELAIPVPLRTVYADPREVVDPVGTAHAVAALLAMTPEAEVALAEKLQDKTSSFTYIARQASQEVADSLIALQLPGVSAYNESGRELTSDGLRALVGRTDPDGLGTSGLEKQFDVLLAGVNGRQVREVSAKGQSIPATQDNSVAAIPGKTLITTIDRNIQFQVDGILAQQIARLQARSGTAIVMDSATGEIFAMSTLRLNEDGTYSADSGNIAAVEANEPGSVAKVFSIAAAINEGKVDATTVFNVPPTFIANKGTKWQQPINDAYPHGLEDMSVRKIIVDSSNVGTLMIGQTIGPDKLHDYLKSFGFGAKSAIDFPGETKGILQSSDKWAGAKKFTTSYGYGYSATALQLIAGVNVVANNGNYVAPRLVTATVTKDGVNEPIAAGEQHAVITPETAATMRSLMTDVVCFGTATLGKVPGMTVAGKTGTAYKRQDNGTYVADDGSRSYFASFIGFIPAQQPRFTVLVSIDEPNADSMDRFGGTAAAPVFANIAQVLISELDIRPNAADLGCPKERPAELGPKH